MCEREREREGKKKREVGGKGSVMSLPPLVE